MRSLSVERLSFYFQPIMATVVSQPLQTTTSVADKVYAAVEVGYPASDGTMAYTRPLENF